MFRLDSKHEEECVDGDRERGKNRSAADESYCTLADRLLNSRTEQEIDGCANQRLQQDPANEIDCGRMIHLAAKTLSGFDVDGVKVLVNRQHDRKADDGF